MRDIARLCLAATLLLAVGVYLGGPTLPTGSARASDETTSAQLSLRGVTAVVRVPKGWISQAMSGGILVQPSDNTRLRSPPRMEIVLGPEASPTGPWPERRDIDGQPAYFKLLRSEGGSGGEMNELLAWKRCGSGHLMVRYTIQSEWTLGSTDLRVPWAVLESAACRSTP